MTYTLKETKLKWCKGYKYLGVWLDERMEWKEQVNRVVAKGTRGLNFVMRTLKGAHSQVKEHAYKTLVRPILEYGGMVWDPYKLGEVKEIERVQRMAARRVTGRMRRWLWDPKTKERVWDSASAIIQQLKWESLDQRREKARLGALRSALCEQKGWKEIGDKLQEGLNLRNEHKLMERGARTEVGRNCFLNRKIRRWNTLNPEVPKVSCDQIIT